MANSIAKLVIKKSPQLKVIHATRVWLPRTQNWLYNQIKHLPDNIETHIFCKRLATQDEFRLPNIHCFADNSVQLRDLAERIRPDILHSHFGSQGWKHVGAATNALTRHVVSFYGTDATFWPQRSPVNSVRCRKLFDNVAGVFCEGPVLATQIVELGCPQDKVILHHLGADLEKIPYRPRSWHPGTTFRVLIAASFREKKGIPFALRALGEIRNKVDLEVTIIGDSRGDADRDEKAKILAAIDGFGLADRMRLMGFQPHSVLMEEAYGHHLFLSPSVVAVDGDAEGGAPVSIIEMAASGMPIVSSIHCDIPEVIINWKTGWLAPEKDWRALADHIEWLINHPNDWRPYLDAGRRRIEEDFNCRTQGVRLSHHYQRLTRTNYQVPRRPDDSAR